MAKKLRIEFTIIFLFIFFIMNISAECTDSQIDINSASLEELDNLSGIGPTKAQEIINSRSYDSIEELIDVKGIGEITLNKIKEQGLACVKEENTEESNEEETLEEENEEIKETEEEEREPEERGYIQKQEIEQIVKKEIIGLDPIFLNAKSIKSEENKENLKRNLSFYGVIAMGLIFGALFLIKNRKRKNEFN